MERERRHALPDAGCRVRQVTGISVVTSKYQWPASRLGDKEMALLFQEKQKAKTSICELLCRAVNIAYGVTLEKKEDQNGYQAKAKRQETKSRRKQEEVG